MASALLASASIIAPAASYHPRSPSISSDDGSSSEVTGDGVEAVEPVRYTRQNVDRRPKSTLHLKDPSELSFLQDLATKGQMDPAYHELQELSLDRGPIPVHSVTYEQLWIAANALIPVVLHQISYTLFPEFQWPVWFAFPIYLIAFRFYLVRVVRHFEFWALKYGTLDEKNIGRDRIPDESATQLARAFLLFLLVRLTGEFALTYDKTVSPLGSIAWTFPIRALGWTIVMDLCFYTYHRYCHQVDHAWYIHQHHHSTRHPSPTLSILADSVQECIEIAIVPLLASLTIPFSFTELWLVISATVYVEILGHTGIRADWETPIAGPFLRPLGLALKVEDHDLHHQYGRSGASYGKGTLVWDTLFGTCNQLKEHAGR